MIVEYQIRQWLARYLSNEISLDQFEDWLVKQSWNMHRDSDEASQKLASALELRLAEYSSGHLDEPALREELVPFVTKYNVPVSFFGSIDRVSIEPPNNVTEMGVLQVAFPGKQLLPPAGAEFVDTRPEAVFG
jgi:hypothetical protein